MLEWLHDRMPACLNLSQDCALLGQLFQDSIHPAPLGRVLYADYLAAYLAAAEQWLAEATSLRCASGSSRGVWSNGSGALGDDACGGRTLPALMMSKKAT